MPGTNGRQEGGGKSDGPRASRGRGLRTNTGCLTCRKRHLKCDETRPVCNLCTRNNKTCLYSDGKRGTTPWTAQASRDDVDPVLNIRLGGSFEPPTTHSTNEGHRSVQRRHQRQSMSQPPSNGSDSALGQGPVEHESLRRQGPTSQPSMQTSPTQLTRVDSRTYDEQRSVLGSPLSHRRTPQLQASRTGTGTGSSLGAQDGHGGPNYTSPASVGTVSDQPVGVATARWFGMLVDDADIPMDANYQLTTSVDQSTYHLIVNDQFPNRSQPSPGFANPTDGVSLANNPDDGGIAPEFEQERSAEELLWRSAGTLSMKPDETNMFQTFVTHISTWIDLFDPYKHFASLVPHLALYNTGLLNAILALSVRHNSLSNKPVFARDDALQYYHQTLQYVRKAMQYTSYHTSLELLATTLIVSAYEMLDGSSRDWERHLQGVFGIQRSQRIHGDSKGLRAAVWWAWLCQDTWAAFRDRRRVFTFWKPERTLAELSTVELASRSVFILGRIMNYCAQDEFDNSANGIMAKIKTAERLTAMLDEWESLLTPEFLPLPHDHEITSSTFEPLWIHPPMYAVSVQIHHASRMLMLLNQPSLGGINQGLQRQAALDNHVAVTCGIALMLTDYASSTMSSQCLFIAGLCTHDRQRRSEILALLADCRQRTGWPVLPLEEELQRYWQASNGEWVDRVVTT